MVTRRNTHNILFAIIGLAILLRVFMALLLGDHADPISGAFDQLSYDTLAQRILAGKGFTFPTNWYPFTLPDQPTAHWSYLYTLYLAAVYAITGHHPLAARLVQVVLSGLNIWLAFRIGRRVFGETVGLTAAALTSVYAYFIFFNAALMTQTFYILAVLAALDTTQGLLEQQTRRGYVLLGVVIGIGALMRQTLLIFAPFLFLWILFEKRRQVQWLNLILAGLVICLFVLPWTLYNYITFHDFLLLNSNGGYWFYSSNHPAQGTNFDQNFAAPLPEALKGLGEPAEDRALYQAGMGFVLADPGRFVLLSLSRLDDYFWLGFSDSSTILSNLGRLFSFAIYLPFMVYGLLVSWRQWRACVPLYLYVAFDTLLCLATWSAPRYRLPSDAIMMVFAGLAMVTLATQLKLRPRLNALRRQ